MKNIIKSTLLLLCSVALLAACSEDRDSNPTVKSPSTFELNTPVYSTSSVDLGTDGEIPFTWSQPDYGFPAPVNYQLQVSLNDNFTVSLEEAEADETGATVASYATLDAVYKEANGSMSVSDLAKALQQLAGWEEDAVPEVATVYVRAAATAATTPTVYSNSVKILTAPVYVELSDAPVELWYLVGACIADGSWNNNANAIGTGIIPMSQKAGEEYNKKTGQGTITYTGYLTSAGFKLIKVPGSWDEQWGQGDAGFVKNDGGSGNITVDDGYYTIELNTATDELTITAIDAPKQYAKMMIAGAFNDWATDVEMNASSTFDGAKNHDWWFDLDATGGDTTAKFLSDGSWDFNWGSDTFPVGWGTQNGSNIPVTAGNYRVVFNDITGAYNFIAQ